MWKKRELFIGLIVFVILFYAVYSTNGTPLTRQTVYGPYPGTISANQLDFTWVAGSIEAATPTTFVCTGNELLLFHNNGAQAYTTTITSVADEYNRTGDITAYSIGAGEFAAFKFTNVAGWRNSSGLVSFIVENASVDVAILDISR